MKYSSLVDGLYTALIIIIGIIGIIVSDLFFILGFWYISLVIITIFGFIYYMFFSTSIELKQDKLQINIGFFKKYIKYSDIKEVKRTKNSISSFATSRMRIGIRTGEKTGVFNYTYISPNNDKDFINKLKEKLDDKVLIND